LELAFWESVKDGTAAELESHLERYPEGTLASLARTRMEEAMQQPESSPEPAAESELSADTEVALELTFWESVKDGTSAELGSYLERYPEGTFASLAKARLESAKLCPEGFSDSASAAAAEELDLAFWNSVKDSKTRPWKGSCCSVMVPEGWRSPVS
jgi:hypothetical protein